MTKTTTSILPKNSLKLISSKCLSFWLKYFCYVIQQTVYIPMGTNGAPLLTDLLLYSYGSEFTQGLLCFVDRCLSVCTFSFGHCVVCSSLIYGFWLPPLVSSNSNTCVWKWYASKLAFMFDYLRICTHEPRRKKPLFSGSSGNRFQKQRKSLNENAQHNTYYN